MKVLSSSEETYRLVEQMRMQGRRIGLVPTMGALHEGHLSLVDRAKQECDVAIATIFVNPTQFGPNEDLQKYPRTLQNDLELLSANGCDVVFTPTRTIEVVGPHKPTVGILWDVLDPHMYETIPPLQQLKAMGL